MRMFPDGSIQFPVPVRRYRPRAILGEITGIDMERLRRVGITFDDDGLPELYPVVVEGLDECQAREVFRVAGKAVGNLLGREQAYGDLGDVDGDDLMIALEFWEDLSGLDTHD